MIKRLLAFVLCLALVLSLVPATVADSGVPQPIATYFSDAKFDHYSIEDCVEIKDYCFVLLKNGKENVLYGFKKSNGTYKYWMRNPHAVPQGANTISLADYTGYTVDGCNQKLNNPSIGILYYDKTGDDIEKMIFYSLISGDWLLKAYINTATNVSVSLKNNTVNFYSYDGHSKKGTVEGSLQRDVRYTAVGVLPMTLKDAQNKLTVAPELPTDSELVAEDIKFTGGKKYAVYSGPGKDFLRGANNKASVSTNDWIQVFGEENGWILIQYAINKDTYRFGYIEASALPKKTEVKELDLNAAEATVKADVSITDDPLFSAGKLASLKADTEVIWLASMGSWAYISTEINNTPVRGFVPANALELTLAVELAEED